MRFGVSLYSFQTGLDTGRMSFEDCLQEMKLIPADVNGVEALFYRPGYAVPGYKQLYCRGLITEKDQAQWSELLEKYGMYATCYDSIVGNPEYDMQRDGVCRMSNPSKDQYKDQMAIMKDEIDFAASFGFTTMRSPNVFGFYEEVIRDSLKYAAEKHIALCAEIHTPLRIDGDMIGKYVEMLDKSDCPEGGGLIPDFGIFAKGLAKPLIRNAIAAGADEKLIERVIECYGNIDKIHELAEEIRTQTDEPQILQVLQRAENDIYEDPKKLLSVAGYIRHVHAKFYEFDETFTEQSIDFVSAVRTLKEAGYEGVLSTEYEGHSFYKEYDPNEVEQVRRQIIATKSLIDNL